MKKNFCFIFLFIFLFAIKNSSAALPTYKLCATNFNPPDISTTDHFSFDIVIYWTNPNVAPEFQYLRGEYRFDINGDAIDNGGVLTYTFDIAGMDGGFGGLYPQALNIGQRPRNPTVFPTGGTEVTQLLLASNSLPGCGNGELITSDCGGCVVIRMKVSTTAVTFSSVPLTLTWRDSPSFPYTKISAYGELCLGSEITDAANHFIGCGNLCCSDCEDGVLDNWNFTQNIVAGDLDDDGSAPPWHTVLNTPRVFSAFGCCDLGYMGLWGFQSHVERMAQEGLTIIEGNQYQISMSVRLNPTIPPNVCVPYGSIGIIFSPSPVTTTSSPGIYNGGIIGPSINGWGSSVNTIPSTDPLYGITNTTWTNYTYIWIADDDYQCININTLNDNVPNTEASYLDIDNICIKDLGPAMGSPLVVDIRNQAMYPINDLVKVSLRSSSSPYSIVDSGSAYSVLEGSHSKVSLFFEHATQGNSYYIVVNHRNSIETWSANPVTILGDSTVYNFTSSLSQAYGNNMILVSGVASIYSGDVNQDGSVDLSDASLVDNDSYNFVFGYVYTDVDGDGFVDASDAAIVDNNAYNFVTVIKP